MMFCFHRVIVLIIVGPESGPEPERPQARIIHQHPVQGPATADAAPRVQPAAPVRVPTADAAPRRPQSASAIAAAINEGETKKNCELYIFGDKFVFWFFGANYRDCLKK
jgi:hypothetical protein